MERFSRRVGLVARPQLAHDETTEELNTALWNVLHLRIFVDVLGSDATRSAWRNFMRHIYPFLHWRLNDLEYNGFSESEKLEKWFFDEREWFERYDLIEFVVNSLMTTKCRQRLTRHCSRRAHPTVSSVAF